VVRAFYRLRLQRILICNHRRRQSDHPSRMDILSGAKRPFLPRKVTFRMSFSRLKKGTALFALNNVSALARFAQPPFVHNKCTKQNFCTAKGAADA